jgi:dTDP-4-amino-4,6-dideoxygalactose transaminase
MTDKRVPFQDLQPQEDAAAVDLAVRRVIERGWFVLGPEVEAFEAEFARASGLTCAVGTGNGTDAIALLLRSLGIGPGDEVITSPLSAAFTAVGVAMTGARPIFADIDPRRLTIAPAAVEAMIGPRTAAILPVHLYGQPADMPALAAVAGRHGLALIEDCCQAHLATCAGRPVGSFGSGAAFSFYPTKNLGALGDGGAACTGDTALAQRLRALRNGGQTARNAHTLAGVNSRLDEIQAAVLRTRLRTLKERTRRRRLLAERYRARLKGGPASPPLLCDPGHVHHLFPVLTPARDHLMAHLDAAGIGTLVHYPTPITKQPAFAIHEPAPCPVAEAACAALLSLPLHPGLDERQVDMVVDTVGCFAPTASGEPPVSQ